MSSEKSAKRPVKSSAKMSNPLPFEKKPSATSEFAFSFDIKFDSKPVPTPKLFSVQDPIDLTSKAYRPTSEFKYLNDVLCGLAYHGVTNYSLLNLQNKEIAKQYFHQTEPYLQLFQRSEHQLKSKLFPHLKPNPKAQAAFVKFENQLKDFMNTTFSNRKLNMESLEPLANLVHEFEQELSEPLIYNFNLKLSEETRSNLVSLYSFLFHLRSLSVSHYNENTQDNCFDVLTCDSISDYIPKSDFTANDAILYWQFKKLSTPFLGVNDRDSKLENLLIKPVMRAFHQYGHNACALINQVPESYLSQLSMPQIEEQLHTLQMNWLLGTSSGLLFRVREEITGLLRGYSDLFWPEAQPLDSNGAEALSFDVRVCPTAPRKNQAA